MGLPDSGRPTTAESQQNPEGITFFVKYSTPQKNHNKSKRGYTICHAIFDFCNTPFHTCVTMSHEATEKQQLIPDFLTTQTSEMQEGTQTRPSQAQSQHSLVFPRKASQMSSEMRLLEQQTFATAFEFALEEIAEGGILDDFVREYHTPLHVGRFRTWIMRDKKRAEAYTGAQAVGARAIEDQMIRIADGLNPDGSPSINDVSRATLQITTRRDILKYRDRKRYGDVKHVEQTTTTTIKADELDYDELRRRLLQKHGLVEDGELVDAE